MARTHPTPQRPLFLSIMAGAPLVPPTPFQSHTLTYLISLPPKSLSAVPTAIESSLNALLFKYDPRLLGVLFHYANIRFENNTASGRVLNETPYIHYKITCDAVVFRPITFRRMQGMQGVQGGGNGTADTADKEEDIVISAMVNKISTGHIGLLIMSKINGSVSSLKLPGWEFSEDEDAWVHEESGGEIRVGDTVKFVAENASSVGGIMDLEGRLDNNEL